MVCRIPQGDHKEERKIETTGQKYNVRICYADEIICGIGSVTARHSGSGRQPNFAALNRGRHLYSAGRPSRCANMKSFGPAGAM